MQCSQMLLRFLIDCTCKGIKKYYVSPFIRPTTLENLLKIEDIAVEKAKKYGPEMLQHIKEFCQEKGIKSDVMPTEVMVAARVSYDCSGKKKNRICISLHYSVNQWKCVTM